MPWLWNIAATAILYFNHCGLTFLLSVWCSCQVPCDLLNALSWHNQVAEANRQWMEEEDGIIDDCTIVIVFLDVSAGEPPQPRTPTPHEVVSGNSTLC